MRRAAFSRDDLVLGAQLANEALDQSGAEAVALLRTCRRNAPAVVRDGQLERLSGLAPYPDAA